MISIQSVVEKIIQEDAEAYAALRRGIMNFSQYAHSIHKQVEALCKKDIRHGSIVIALTRLSGDESKQKNYTPKVEIHNITTKLPVTEIVYHKTQETLASLETLFKKVKASVDDFFVMTLSTTEITIICSDPLIKRVEEAFSDKPKMKQSNLAAIGLSFDEKYYKMANVTFSLIRELAMREIVIAETVSSYTEVVFICHQKDLSTALDAFRSDKQVW